MADLRAAEAMMAGADGYDGYDLLPVPCRRHRVGDRSAVMRRLDMVMATHKEVPCA